MIFGAGVRLESPVFVFRASSSKHMLESRKGMAIRHG
jgi:hypothetical protein